jgi:hypothetical protein
MHWLLPELLLQKYKFFSCILAYSQIIIVAFVAGFLLGLNKHNNYHDEHLLENKKLAQTLILISNNFQSVDKVYEKGQVLGC